MLIHPFPQQHRKVNVPVARTQDNNLKKKEGKKSAFNSAVKAEVKNSLSESKLELGLSSQTHSCL